MNGDNIGLFQVNTIHGYSAAYLLDAEQNVAVAAIIYADQGWGPWSCRP